MGTNGRKRILLADDHAAMLEEVESLLRADYRIVGSVENGVDLVEAAQRLKPDLIISDISMPVMNGFEAAARIRAAGVTAKLIFLTVQSGAPYVKKARALGADGYVLKAFTAEHLAAAVSAVLAGNPYICPQLPQDAWL
ncbi:MAG: response regulator transcription factor [Acidobacteriia bacterium]|nr:response regulator transcription factor [Terriglobia bacterium]